jgi:hypothetical protein
MMPGDYYDEDGDWIGTDGRADDKNYLVTNRDEARETRETRGQSCNIAIPGTGFQRLDGEPPLRLRDCKARGRQNSPTSLNELIEAYETKRIAILQD